MDSDEKRNRRSRFSVLPLTVSLETVGGIATPIVMRGTPLPSKRSQVFSTAADNQTAVSIQLFYGERPIASDNYPVGTFEVTGIPPASQGEPQIQIIVEISKYCDITVLANDKITGRKLEVKENRKEFTINTETIGNAIYYAERNRTNDQQRVKLAEQVVKRQGLISKAEKKLREDTDQLSNRREIEKALAELGIAIESGNAEEIEAKTDKLEKSMLTMPDIFDSSLFSSFFGGVSSAKKTAPKVRPQKPNNIGTSVSSSAPDSKIGKIFGARVITLDPNLCFVLMPFKSEMKPIYEDHIKPSVEKAGLTCLRADEIVGTNMITVDIWESINRARFIIADLTGQNPNVFYELGLAHAIGKDVVLITQTTKDVPFDLKLLRCIVYSYDPRGVKDLEAKLVETIKAIIAKG